MSASVIYVHGAGNKPPAPGLKQAWDRDLFGRDMAQQTQMAHYADLLHARPGSIGADACTLEQAFAALITLADEEGEALPMDAEEARDRVRAEDADLFSGLSPEGQELALRLTMSIAAQATARPPIMPEAAEAAEMFLPLPEALRRRLLRELLQRLIPDADAYFFGAAREAIRNRLRQALDAVTGPVVVVGHSLGTVVAYDVLCEPRFADRPVPLLVSLGSPLGYTEIQDVVTRPLRVPAPVRLWANFADPVDVITLDTSLSDDFRGGPRIIDARVDNPSPNSHASCGYLRNRQVRAAVSAALVESSPLGG